MLVDTLGNTKQEIGIGSIIQNFSFLLEHLFEENTYFQKVLVDFYGEKEAGLIIKLLHQGFITKDEYSTVKKIKNSFGSSEFYESLDLEVLNTAAPFQFAPETLRMFLGEIQISFEQKMYQYRVYEIVYQKKLPASLQRIARGDTFEILLDDSHDIYYLHIGESIYTDRDLLWKEKNDGTFLENIIFSGDGKTFVYTLKTRHLDTFEGDLQESFNIDTESYIHIIGERKNIIYGVDNEFLIEGNFIYRFFVETSDDILFFTSNYKVNKAGKKRAHNEIFSKSYGENILEFEGELLQLIEHASGDYVSYIEEESVLGEYGIQEIYHIVCARIEEETLGNYILKQVLKTPHKVQKHILPGQKESYTRMNVQLLSTNEDLFARIAYFIGNTQRDTPLYDLVSLTGGASIRVISGIQKWKHSDDGIYIEYSDIAGNPHIFDSQRQHQNYSQ